MENMDKNIDESWKDTVEKEKEELKKAGKPQHEEPDFNFFITTFSLQAAIALGEIANPVTNKKEENLSQAKFIIDTIAVLKDKTKGNLTGEESTLLENVLYELRMVYISKFEGKNDLLNKGTTNDR
ncbi:MAG: DUF1844 domain-containing protein [Candidatus Omnitrophota bacterium]|jgi:hypothetical protein